MKIAFYGNPASQSTYLSRGLRKKGFDVVDVYGKYHPVIDKRGTINITSKKYGLPFERTIREFLRKKLAKKYDLVIANAINDNNIFKSKNIIYWYHGAELGTGKITNPKTPSLVAHRALLKYSPSSLFQFRAVDDEFFKINQKEKKEEITISSFRIEPRPDSSNAKLSKFEDAFNKVKSERSEKLVLNKFVNIPHEQLPKYFKESDYVFDRLSRPFWGTYGITSLEASLSGNYPLVSYDEEYIDSVDLIPLLGKLDEDNLPESIHKSLDSPPKLDRGLIIKYHGITNAADFFLKNLSELGVI